MSSHVQHLDTVSPAGIYYFRPDGFHSFFYNNDDVFSGIILSDFQDVLSVRVLFHGVDNSSHQVPTIMSLKGPYDFLRGANLEACVRASRPL